ncbi:hypothetical protein [Roseateles aquatilis]|uniref:hypothetical protein n=1 Tax=Roseateles aquatilis TaxID=431061 RepID=UPI0011320D61|nr:hypothetical protein [Roseateles aquatilis]
MPSVTRDNHLLSRVAAFILLTGSVASAARQLGVNRVTLWRFANSGCAISRTRLALDRSLSALQSETAGTGVAEQQKPHASRPGLAPELQGLRDLCTRVVSLIDALEAGAQPQWSVAGPGTPSVSRIEEKGE